MTLLVDFRQQSFNDALSSLEEAYKIDKLSHPFAYWKYCTWSIISSCMCMESYIKSHVVSIISEIDPTILQIYEQPNGLGFIKCVKFLELITDCCIIDDCGYEWSNIDKTRQLRNDIVHFNRPDIFNSIHIENAENAIQACRDMVKKFHLVMDLPLSNFASWINKKHSQNYDKP